MRTQHFRYYLNRDRHCHKSKTVLTAQNGFPILQIKTLSMELLCWLTLQVIDQLIPVRAL